jgi:hypothetical protein
MLAVVSNGLATGGLSFEMVIKEYNAISEQPQTKHTLAALADDLKKQGMTVPIRVHKCPQGHKDVYVVEEGHRRLLAAIMIGVNIAIIYDDKLAIPDPVSLPGLSPFGAKLLSQTDQRSVGKDVSIIARGPVVEALPTRAGFYIKMGSTTVSTADEIYTILRAEGYHRYAEMFLRGGKGFDKAVERAIEALELRGTAHAAKASKRLAALTGR